MASCCVPLLPQPLANATRTVVVHLSAALGCSASTSWGTGHLGTVTNPALLMHAFAAGCEYQQRSVSELALPYKS